MVSVAPPIVGPCAPWVTPDDVRTCKGCVSIDADDALLETNAQIASEVLYLKSGHQFTGTCTETLRPCCQGDLCAFPDDWWRSWGFPYRPELIAGAWYNVGFATDQCLVWECGEYVNALDLGVYPVTKATVTIDGVALAPSKYTIRQNRYLVRTDGSRWPTGQKIDQPTSAVGTWSVAVEHGFGPPETGIYAAKELACELTKFCVGEKCMLPLNVTQVSRQGVNYSMTNVNDLLNEGRTGLYWTDLFLATYNPHNLSGRPRVLSPDLRPAGSRYG